MPCFGGDSKPGNGNSGNNNNGQQPGGAGGAKKDPNKVSVLLLGAGESGKSMYSI